MKSRRPYPLVIVEWNDAQLETDDIDRASVSHAPLVLATVGWLVRRDKKGVSVAMEYTVGDENDLRTVQFVPAGMIRRVVIVRKA